MDPKQIGTYEVLERIPSQTPGALYKGKIGDRLVVLKTIPSLLTNDEEFKDRFLREMEVVSRLDHPNIVQAFDFGMEVQTNTYYLVYEYLEGENLSQGLARLGNFPHPMALRITRQVAKGLQHALEKDIVHRNINPENIFLCEDGNVKITNLGLAKFMRKSSITQIGNPIGNPFYMAPEQAMSEEVDIRADLYSLGITLYHMLAGRPPFMEKVPMKMVESHCFKALPPLSTFVQNVPEKVEQLILKMTEKDKDKRYSTPQEVADAIASLDLS